MPQSSRLVGGYGSNIGSGTVRPLFEPQGGDMRRTALAAIVIAVMGTLAGAQAVSAASTGVDLATTGSVMAGVTSAQAGGQELAFSFSTKNNSTTTSVSLAVTFTVTNGTLNATDYICPLISNHFNINADTPSCEPGVIGPGKTASTGLLVATKNSGTLTVKACSSNLDGLVDPVSSNNCRTLSVKIV